MHRSSWPTGSIYQCPYCKQEEESVFPQLVKDYVDTGKLKIVYKDFAFLGPDSDVASRAARAVWAVAPDKFREWHRAMFDHQDQENAGWGSEDDILALTGTIAGIDVDKVKQMMTDKTSDFDSAMQADANEGYTMGVGGTPSFLIGKQMMVGAQPYEKLKTAIDAELKATGGYSPPRGNASPSFPSPLRWEARLGRLHRAAMNPGNAGHAEAWHGPPQEPCRGTS